MDTNIVSRNLHFPRTAFEPQSVSGVSDGVNRRRLLVYLKRCGAPSWSHVVPSMGEKSTSKFCKLATQRRVWREGTRRAPSRSRLALFNVSKSFQVLGCLLILSISPAGSS